MEKQIEEQARLGLIPVDEVVAAIVTEYDTEAARISSLLRGIVLEANPRPDPRTELSNVKMILEWCRPFLDDATHSEFIRARNDLEGMFPSEADEDEMGDRVLGF